MGFLEFIFGNKKRQVDDFLERGATILDVRTQKEWDRGHISQATHIPLAELNNRVEDFKKLKPPVITCCESGIRSAKAAKFLNLHNIEATNAGGWLRLNQKL